MKRLAVAAIILSWPGLATADVFDSYVASDIPAADGFATPRLGPGAVSSIGRGRVVSVDDGVVIVDHVYFENHKRHAVRSRYAGLTSVSVKAREVVQRAQTLGFASTPASADLVDGTSLSQLVKGAKRLFVPMDEPVLLLVDHATHKMARYEKGVQTHLVEVGFGQAEGKKERQGDLKTPKGMYFVVSKYRGKFSGPTAPYYGGHWIKLNYPNAFDASRGIANKWISKKTAGRIAKRWRDRKLTNQKTTLGGGIGFHGWAGPWRLEDGGGLSWGCVVLHNPDIKDLFEKIPEGTMVVIF